MFGYFTEDARKALVLSRREKDNLGSEFISTKHLLLAILYFNNSLCKKLNSYGITYAKVKKLLCRDNKRNNDYYYSPELKKILEKIIIDSKDHEREISLEDLFISIIDNDTEASKIIKKVSRKTNEILNDLNNRKNNGLLIDKLGINLTNEFANVDRVIGRDKEVDELIEILNRRNKCNPLLVGEAGVGKTAIVEGLAYKIIKRDVPDSLQNKKIYSLDLASILSGTKYRGEFEEKIKRIIDEIINNEDIILFIDEIHTLVGAGASMDGGLDASNILKPYLSRGKIKIIGATTINEYSKTIEKDKALDRRFKKIIIKEPDKNMLKEILLNIKKQYEEFHGVIISNEVIDEIIKLSKKYIYNKKEPDRSIDILDDVSSKVALMKTFDEKELDNLNHELDIVLSNKRKYLLKRNYKKLFNIKRDEVLLRDSINKVKLKILMQRKHKKITINDVQNIISEKSLIPVLNDIDINDLKSSLRNKIINQENAIDKLIDIVKKLKYNLKDDNKSYSLLFSGNTGVGKTYLAKEFSKYLTNNIIKIDMNEYILPESINKLIGAPQGYVGYNEETLLDKVKNNPYSVLILDEIEKANTNILNFFLNILDEGYALDNKGNKIRFDNVIIIMTTNAIMNKKSIGFDNKTRNDFSAFPKEFINRIDELITFNDATLESVKLVIDKVVNDYNNKYNKRIVLSNEEENEIISKSDFNIFGYRKLGRLIKKKLYNILVETI